VSTLSRNLRSAVLFCVVCNLLQWPFSQCAVAHHSMRAYDNKRVVTISGAVTRIKWASPHVYVYIAQPTATQSVEWELEALSPGVLRRGGWSKDSLRPGDQIVVSGYPARDANKKIMFPTLLKLGTQTLYDFDKRVVTATSAGPAPETGAKGLNGIWVTLLSLPVSEKLNVPEMKKLTPKGKQAFMSFPIQIDCVPDTAPASMVAADVKRVTVEPRTIRIEGELSSAQRVIHLDVKTHAGSLPSIQGHSIGWWDGKTLVVDTANFAYHAHGGGDYVASGAHKRLIERLTPAADGRSLTYHFEMTDPEHYNETISGDVEWVYRPDMKYEPAPCELDNARRFLQE
jgi:hypothetical protein